MQIRLLLTIYFFLFLSITQKSYAEIPNNYETQNRPVLFVGDSILHGGAANSSAAKWATTSVSKEFCTITGYNCINRAENGVPTKNIADTFEENIVETNPWLIIANGGLNNIAVENDKQSFLTDWKSILETAKKNNIKIIILLVTPWTNGTNNKQLQREDFNNALRNLVAVYDNAMAVDVSKRIGEYRPSGTKGNLWNIKKSLQVDGVHFTNAGYHEIANMLADAIAIKPKSEISNIRSDIKSNTITLSWRTDQQSYASVIYGSYEKELVRIEHNPDPTKEHKIRIENLKPCTIYPIKIVAKANIFSESNEENRNIITSGCAPVYFLYAKAF